MIGIFDSGSGGLTVLSELKKIAPKQDLIYFGDIKNVPYGNKSREELGALTAKAIDLLSFYGAKKIVSACNSVSATIIKSLAQTLSTNGIDIVEMVGPTAKYLSKVKNKKILVISTKATHESKIYQDSCSKNGFRVESIPMPSLAEKIENGEKKEEIISLIKNELTEIKKFDGGIIVLGCTQFPLSIDSFKEVISKNNLNIELFNPGHVVAKHAIEKFGQEGNGTLTFLLSKDSKLFRDRTSKLFIGKDYKIEII